MSENEQNPSISEEITKFALKKAAKETNERMHIDALKLAEQKKTDEYARLAKTPGTPEYIQANKPIAEQSWSERNKADIAAAQNSVQNMQKGK